MEIDKQALVEAQISKGVALVSGLAWSPNTGPTHLTYARPSGWLTTPMTFYLQMSGTRMEFRTPGVGAMPCYYYYYHCLCVLEGIVVVLSWDPNDIILPTISSNTS